MPKETRYGVISDVHKDPGVVESALEVLQREGIDKLILNGDVGEPQANFDETLAFISLILESAGKTGLETYVQPGSHERFLSFNHALEQMCAQYPNLINTMQNPFSKDDDHDLVFIPGSDWTSGGEYLFGDKHPTGTHIQTKEGEVTLMEDIRQYVEMAYKDDSIKVFHYTNINDLRDLVERPDDTIAVCHVPRRFDTRHGCVDLAFYAQSAEGHVRSGMELEIALKEQFGNIPAETMQEIARQNSLQFQIGNRGNEALLELYDELGITKAVSGHFHESGHRAHDDRGFHIPSGEFVDELYWNSGCLDNGQTGIFTVQDGKIAYKNITL